MAYARGSGEGRGKGTWITGSANAKTVRVGGKRALLAEGRRERKAREGTRRDAQEVIYKPPWYPVYRSLPTTLVSSVSSSPSSFFPSSVTSAKKPREKRSGLYDASSLRVRRRVSRRLFLLFTFLPISFDPYEEECLFISYDEDDDCVEVENNPMVLSPNLNLKKHSLLHLTLLFKSVMPEEVPSAL